MGRNLRPNSISYHMHCMSKRLLALSPSLVKRVTVVSASSRRSALQVAPIVYTAAIEIEACHFDQHNMHADRNQALATSMRVAFYSYS